MKKLVSLLISIVLLYSVFSMTIVNAENSDLSIDYHDYIGNKATVSLYEDIDLTEYAGEGPFDLYGIEIDSIIADPIGVYRIQISEASGLTTQEATDILKQNENVKSAYGMLYDWYANGDVNGNGVFDKTDYILLKRACFGTAELSYEEMGRANVYSDDVIDSMDYVMLKRYCFANYEVGKIPVEPDEPCE